MDRVCPQAAEREHSGIFTLIIMLRRIIYDSKRVFMVAVGLGFLALALSFYVYPCFRQAAFTLPCGAILRRATTATALKQC